MGGSPQLHVSMPHVEKLADFLVLLLPIFLLTSPGAIQSGLASTAVLDHDIRRCYSATDDAALGHDCCILELSEGNMWNVNRSRGSVSYRIEVLFMRLFVCWSIHIVFSGCLYPPPARLSDARILVTHFQANLNSNLNLLYTIRENQPSHILRSAYPTKFDNGDEAVVRRIVCTNERIE
jgi:hypothetical protein